MQPAGADTIGAPFVFLNLLEGKADGVAQFLLAHAQQGPALTHPGADMDIDGIGAVA